MSAIAERVLAARDALLVARAEKAAAKKSFQDACANLYFDDANGVRRMKFDKVVVEAEHDPFGGLVVQEERYWTASEAFRKHDKSVLSYEPDDYDQSTTHPDFVAMCEARNAMIAANRRHGVALRKLLSIGVKRNGK